MKYLSLLLPFFFVASTALAKVRLETTLEPREATVGDLLVLQIKTVADTPGACRLDLEKTAGPFEVVSISSGPDRLSGDQVERDFQVTLTLFDVGVSTLPALTVTCTEQKKTSEVKTPEIPVTVKSVLTAESKDIHGLKGRLRKVWNRPVVIGLLILLVVLAVLVWWVRFRPGRPGAKPPGPPPVPPHVRALEDLRRLEEELTAPAKVFYSRLTDILRAYLEGAFQAPAMDRTTAEIAAELKLISISTDQRMGLRTVLEDGDLAKFAKLEPTEEERLADFERVRDFVVATKPAPTTGGSK
ncbi:MAG: hypothetical protein JNK54_08015 [Elusimicrobia bacterium]|jgi:hypothetical protein|nr:hypothetical protein [Elusimicrobiota bacterium]